MSPTRKANCSTLPATPARMVVFASSTSAWDSSASALAFSAGSRARYFRLGTRFCRGGGRDRGLATFYGDLELLDIAAWNDARIASEQLLLGLEFVQGLLMGAPGFLDLPLGSLNVGSRARPLVLAISARTSLGTVERANAIADPSS
jgi:hypothetical protein